MTTLVQSPTRAYDQSMTTRITVSLPDHLVERMNEQVAAGRAASVSAFVADAVTDALGGERTLDVLNEWAAEDGPLTPEEEQWVENALAVMERAAKAKQ